MTRRKLIGLLGGIAIAWPLVAHAQQAGRIRRVGVLANFAADDPVAQPRLATFVQELQSLGWVDGRNLHVDIRWGAGDPERIRMYVAELVALTPDVILAVSSQTTGPLLQTTRTVPVVFVQIADPVGSGFATSLARPGGNATGFTNFEFGTSGKWLELLKEIAPRVVRAGVLRDAANVAEIGMFGAIQSAAASLGMELSPVGMHGADEIERGITAFAREPNRGLIVVGASSALAHREQIITLAAKHKLPVVYTDRAFVSDGGLISYGPDRIEQYRHAAGYVDRILKGANPADLPVQAPVKYELVINLKTAKTLGLDVPPMLIARADQVIE